MTEIENAGGMTYDIYGNEVLAENYECDQTYTFHNRDEINLTCNALFTAMVRREEEQIEAEEEQDGRKYDYALMEEQAMFEIYKALMGLEDEKTIELAKDKIAGAGKMRHEQRKLLAKVMR